MAQMYTNLLMVVVKKRKKKPPNGWPQWTDWYAAWAEPYRAAAGWWAAVGGEFCCGIWR
jgi:hypothetical protein